MKKGIPALLLTLSVLVLATAHSSLSQDSPPVENPALEVTLDVGPSTPPAHIPAITLQLRDNGSAELRVPVSSGCGPDMYGANHGTNHVVLYFTDLWGNTMRLRDKRGNAFCGGTMGFHFVTVAPGATVSVPIELDHYYALSPDVEGPNSVWAGWLPGRLYHVRAELAAGSLGQYKSNQIDVHFPA